MNHTNTVNGCVNNIPLNPSLAAEYNNKGLACMSNGQHDYAVNNFTKAIQFDANIAAAYNNRGIAYMNKGQYDFAINDFSKAFMISLNFASKYKICRCNLNNSNGVNVVTASLDSALVSIYNNRAFAYRCKGQYDSAIADLSKAILLKPDLSESYNNRGLVYYDNGEYNNAIEDFSNAIMINPHLSYAYYKRGLAYNQIGEYQKAKNDLVKSIQINTDLAKAYNKSALTCKNINNLPEKAADCEKKLNTCTYDNRNAQNYEYKTNYDGQTIAAEETAAYNKIADPAEKTSKITAQNIIKELKQRYEESEKQLKNAKMYELYMKKQREVVPEREKITIGNLKKTSQKSYHITETRKRDTEAEKF